MTVSVNNVIAGAVLLAMSGVQVTGTAGMTGISGVGGAGGPQLPAVANLAARWSATSITPQADNSNLTSWTDSVNGYVMSQATGANQPKYRTNRVGTKPGVQFATGSQWLSASIPALKSVIDSQVYTVLIVVSNAQSCGNGMSFGNSAGGDAFAYLTDGTRVGRFSGGYGLAVPAAATAMTTMCHTSRNTAQYPLQSGTGLERLYVNGMCASSNTGAGPATSSSSGGFAIGAGNDLGQLACKSDVHEVIVWNRVLSPLEVAQAESYLRTQYGQALPWAGLTSLDMYLGDSLIVGVGTNDPSKGPAYLAATARSRTLGQWCIGAVGGCDWISTQQQLTEFSTLSAYTGLPLNVHAFEWYNERNSGRSGATIYANASSFATAARAVSGAKLCLLSSTGYNGDAGDPYASVRGAYNALMDTNGATIADVYGPIHSDATAGPAIANSGAYAANSAANWSDGVHLTAAGYQVLANYMTARMNAMRA